MYNLTHSSDLDGMASAAMLVHYFKLPIENVIFINYGGELFGEALRFVERISGSGHILVISDFGASEPAIGSIARSLSSFRRKGNRIIWVDHHPWSNSSVLKMSKLCDVMVVGENKDFCGAELVYRLLCGKSAFGDKLAEITHLADFALKSRSEKMNRLVDKLSYSIKYLGAEGAIDNPKLRELVLELSAGKMESKLVNRAYSVYKKETAPYMRELLDAAEILTINGIRIAVGFGIKLSHQEACMAMMEKLDCDISIYVNKDNGNSSIRSRRDSAGWGIESMQISMKFGGGGHPLASGFSLYGKGYDLEEKGQRQKVTETIRGMCEGLYGKRIMYYNQRTTKRKTIVR